MTTFPLMQIAIVTVVFGSLFVEGKKKSGEDSSKERNIAACLMYTEPKASSSIRYSVLCTLHLFLDKFVYFYILLFQLVSSYLIERNSIVDAISFFNRDFFCMHISVGVKAGCLIKLL